MKSANHDTVQGDFVYVEPMEGSGKKKIGGQAILPYMVLDRNDRTLVIRRGEVL